MVLELPQLSVRTLLVASSALLAFCAANVVHAQTAVSLVTPPVVSQPSVSPPIVSQPSVTQPTVGQPTVSQPSVSQPSVSQPSVSQPSVSQPLLRFSVENVPQVQPVSYSLQIAADGSGIYRGSFSNDGGTVQKIELAVHIHEPLLSHLFQAVRSQRFFAECEPLGRRVAFTGKKTVEYTGPAGAKSCTFNYSSEKSANNVAEQLMAVAYTLQEGVRLNRDHRYDRLGLYDELALLKDAAQDHRALELENIAPELQSIAQDGEVMNIARRRAQALLQTSWK